MQRNIITVKETGFDAPEISIKGAKHSNFFITLNTNRIPANDAEEETLRRIIADSVRGMSDWKVFKDLLRNMDVLDIPVPPDKVHDVRIQFVTEKGKKPKGGRVHAHILIKVTHSTRLRLDLPNLKAYFLDYFDAHNPEHISVANVYLNVRAVRSNKSIYDYLEKDTLFHSGFQRPNPPAPQVRITPRRPVQRNAMPALVPATGRALGGTDKDKEGGDR